MKKHALAIVALVALVVISSPLFAQDDKMMFGFKGGINLANITGDVVEDEISMKTGLVGGLFICYRVTETVALQTEFLYSMKGCKLEDPDVEMIWNLNYLEIPLLFKVNLPTRGNLKPSLYAGPALGILMSAEGELKIIETGEGGNRDIKDQFEETDIGIIAGAGLGYKMGSGCLFGEFRYEVGLQCVRKNSDGDGKNSGMSIMGGYGFAF